MLNSAKRILTAGLALVAMLLLAGCDDTARYTVKAYSQGSKVAEFQARSLTIDGNGVASFTQTEGGRLGTVSSGYAMHRIDDTSKPTSPLVFHATLYSGGKAIETFDSATITAYRDRASLEINGTQRAVFNGTYVVHHIGANVEGTPDSARFEVTLYNDGVSIGTWFADSTSTSQGGGLVLTVNGIANALTIGGQYVIKQIR